MKKIAILLLLISCMGMASCTSETPTPNVPTPPGVSATTIKNITVDTTANNSTQALDFLKNGNKRFVQNNCEIINVSSERRNALKNGQHPFAVVVACSDSRVAPELIFNAGLGEIFDVRLAGNIVDDDAMGSIEYAVDHLNTPLIVVVGHESCGAVTAAYDEVIKGQQVTGHMQSIVDEIKPAISANESINDAVNKNITNMVNRIKLDPIIKEKIIDGKVDVIGAYYNLDGTVTFYENNK